MGLVESYASLIVRRHCCVFWSTLVGSLLFGVAGGALLMLDGFGQGKLFAVRVLLFMCALWSCESVSVPRSVR